MAETLTFENTQEATSVDNLTPDEQDSLEVGEALQEEQENLLAGKYKDAQELEKAYVELQKKLGDESNKNNESTDESEVQETEEVSEEKEEAKDSSEEFTILDDLWEESASGKEFSKELLDELGKLTTGQLASKFLKWRADAETKVVPKQQDLSEADVKQLKDIVGGDREYNNMLKWADENLNKQEVEMFDQVMERGDPLAAFFAVRSLAYRYQDQTGYEGKMLTGKPAKSSGDVFRSQAEVVKAMSHPDYENDPAYRIDVMKKLERSDVNF